MLLSIKSARINKIIRALVYSLLFTVLVSSCKQIDLRDYVIDKVVGLEEVKLDSPQATNQVDINITIEWVEVEGSTGYRYQWDSIDPEGWTETAETSFTTLANELTEGDHVLYLQVKNSDGLWSSAYSFDYVIDSTLPNSPIVTGSDSTSSKRPTWAWSAVDSATGYSYQLDGKKDGSWTETAVLSYTPAADLAIGLHTLYVRAKNSDNKWSGWGSKTTEVKEVVVDPGDTTPPTIISDTPGTAESATTVNIVITFSEAMNTTSAENAFTLKEGASPGSTLVPGTFSWSSSDTIMTFNPTSDLASGQPYTYALAASATDLAENPLSLGIDNTQFSIIGDTTPPTIVSHTPGTNDSNPDVNIVITFSEAMDTASVEGAFSLTGPNPATTDIPGSFSWTESDTVMTFNPTSNLTNSETYTYALTTSAKDTSDNDLITGITNTEFTIIAGIFTDGPYTGGVIGTLKSVDYNGSNYICVYMQPDGDYAMKSFTNPTNFSTASENMIETMTIGSGAVDIAWNGSTYGIAVCDVYGEYNVYFYTADADGITPDPELTDPKIIKGDVDEINTPSSVNIIWDSFASEWVILWEQDSNTTPSTITYDLFWARADADGDLVAGPFNITNSSTASTKPSLIQMGTQFGVLFTEDITDNEGYFMKVPSGYDGTTPPTKVQITDDDTTGNGIKGSWDGNNLGVTWFDADTAYATKKMYFARLDSNGALLEIDTGIYELELPNAYIEGYSFVHDKISIDWNGSAFGLTWSQRDTSSFGQDEVQFCTISNSPGNWEVDANPIIISHNDANESHLPRLFYDGSRWCVFYEYDPENSIQFIY